MKKESETHRKSAGARRGRQEQVLGEAPSPGGEREAPDLQVKPVEPGKGVAYNPHDQPPHAVTAVLAENIQGVEEEIVGLRTLGRKLLERQEQEENRHEAARLGDAYTRTAYRLAGLIQAEAELAKKGGSSEWVEAVLAAMDQHEVEEGRVPISQGVRVQALGREEELGANSRRMVEEVAAMRLVLRTHLRLALETEQVPDFLHLVDIYGHGCTRLLRLLRMEAVDSGKLERYLWELIDGAIQENARIMGLE
jgi:hypothetical protein